METIKTYGRLEPMKYTIKDVEILSEKLLSDDYFKLIQYQLKFKTFSGQWSEPVTRSLMKTSGAVGVLIHDPALEKVLLVEQFRIGAMEDQKSPWLLEIVAGRIDYDASPEAIAMAEAREEAGVEITNIESLYAYWVSPGCISEYTEVFLAEADLSQAGGVHGSAHEHEDIRVQVVTYDELKELLARGELKSSISVIAAQAFFLRQK